jgi:hypothetical protein
MSETAGSLADALLRRVRDPRGTATDIFSVFNVLSHCQRFVNAATRAVLIDVPLYRFPGNPFIQISGITPPILRVEQVRAFGRTLERGDWTQLQNHDPTWLKRRASLPLFWSQIGGDLLCIWPSAISQDACQVVVTGTKYTADLTVYNQPLELPDHHAAAILTMGEELLLLRQRLMSLAMKAAAERQKVAIGYGRPT